MSSEVAKAASTELAISTDQKDFTPAQRTALQHMGVDNATNEDLQIFFHQAKRTGLDPFTNQIHMIGRNSYNGRTKQWETKYTIQTGIDGFRLIGRRAADQAGETISMDQAEWLHEDGSWRPAWSNKWGLPLAARVRILRNGQPFTAVAMFDEYAQRKRDGDLTQMWAQRPAGQLSKCAEALAWRMAFPQDLAGMYTAEEMHQANNADTSLGYEQQEQAQAAQQDQDQQDFEQQAEQSIQQAWDSLEQLQSLGSWAANKGWPKEYVDRIRARWQELKAMTQEQREDIVDAEVIDEPEK